MQNSSSHAVIHTVTTVYLQQILDPLFDWFTSNFPSLKRDYSVTRFQISLFLLNTLPGPHMNRLNGFANFFVFVKIFEDKIRNSSVRIVNYFANIVCLRCQRLALTHVFSQYLRDNENFRETVIACTYGGSGRVF